MSEACQPIFRYGAMTVKPGVPESTTMLEISLSPVRAVIVTHFVIGVPELVMNVFCPSIDPLAFGVVEHRARARRARVGAGLGFGEPERAEHLARDHRHEVLLLLLLGTGVEERCRTEAHTGFERDRHRRVDAARAPRSRGST